LERRERALTCHQKSARELRTVVLLKRHKAVTTYLSGSGKSDGSQSSQSIAAMLWRLRAFPDFCEPWADRPALREMEKDYLILKRASASRTSGKWSEDDFDVLADGVVVGRIMKANAAPVDAPWLWTLAFGHHEDRTPTHGYAATREAAMAAFAKSWRRE
jgi:hypothetical protein